MNRRVPRGLTICLAGLLSVLPAGPARAGGPGTWTKLAEVGNGFDTVGMLRTADGKLHLVWLKFSKTAYGTSTIALNGPLLSTGTALSGWNNDLGVDPQLVRNGSDLRLIFEGSMGSGFYAHGLVYTATSVTGSTWTLVHGSMSSHSAGIGNLWATTEKDGTTPVATFAAGHLFHVGVDPNAPASTPDKTITPTVGSVQTNPGIATDAGTGSVWVGWWQAFKKPGYWVERILPTPQGNPVEAPGSDDSSPKQGNQPNEPVALTARPGGGVYMAYCTATSTQACAHIDLWKVGASTAMVVPGSTNSTHTRVTLAAGLKGRLSVVWYDGGKNVIHAVRTNTTATKFGVIRTIKPPPNSFGLDSVQAEGTFGRLDVVVNDEVSTGRGVPRRPVPHADPGGPHAHRRPLEVQPHPGHDRDVQGDGRRPGGAQRQGLVHRQERHDRLDGHGEDHVPEGDGHREARLHRRVDQLQPGQDHDHGDVSGARGRAR